jgi:hypothetical protein
LEEYLNFLKMEDDLKKIMQLKTIKSKTNGLEDDLILFCKRKTISFFLKLKTTSKKMMQPNTSKSNNNGCGTAPGNLV